MDRLALHAQTYGLVVFADGGGDRSAFSAALHEAGVGTLVLDVQPDEPTDQSAQRFLLATRRAQRRADLAALPIGYFAAGDAVGAALVAAAASPIDLAAVVTYGGSPALAGPHLGLIRAPALLMLGGIDGDAIALEDAVRATHDWFVRHFTERA